jgi:N12 class adenine-specific DNA methylase
VDDKAYNKLGFNIHNYFFAKALDQVRPGGIVAFVTSRYTMDAKSEDARKYLAERAELLGAIRLPNNAFQANAGTNVVSDILFLQKRERVIAAEADWVHLGQTEDGITLNSYYVNNPQMVLGELTTKSTQYGRDECTVKPIPGADLGQQLQEAVQYIHGQYLEAELTEAMEVDDSIPADPDVRNFSYTTVDGQIYYRENSRMKAVSLSEGNMGRIRALIELRDCVRTLMTYETEDYPEADIQHQQRELNQLYDSFQAMYGRINSQPNRRVFADDDSYYLLCSLEVLDDEQHFKEKAAIFTKRTIRPKAPITKADTAQEALVLCLNDRATVDMLFMQEISGKSPETLEQELSGQIFRLPYTDKFVLAEEYLSGNVREKLQEAQSAAQENPIYTVNVAALEQVQPKDLSAAEISVRLGSTWVPEADVRQFILELLNPPWYLRGKIQISYSPYTSAWQLDGKSVDKGIHALSTYGTQRKNAYEIIEDTLNLREVKVFDYVEADGKRKAVLNKKETAIAQGKQAEIKQAFQDWIWKAPERRERLTTLYNEKFNSIRPREYDGSHLIFPGMNPEITLRTHQKNAIARALYGGNTLLAHCVGAGKTFEIVTIAQESKRLGICHKSMVVVPNHLIGQWASEYLQLYPAANILVARESDFATGNRKTFCSRIATGEYDAVIIGHSQFEKIPLSQERQIQALNRQIDNIVTGIAKAKIMTGENFTIKQLTRAKKVAEAKLKKLMDQGRKDNVVTFEELGIDRLFVDEAHSYKNLAVVTKMQNVAGISQTESQKASNMFMVCQYLDEITDSHGVVFATGTPVSNTMVELYTMQRYLQYRTLEHYGLANFDAWAANFGETVTAIELSPEGTGYRTKTRFAKFYNLPELIYMFRMVADIQTADMLKLPVPEARYHVVQLEPSEIQTDMVQDLSQRADRVRNKMVDPKEDNMLRITSDGRKLALDQRLMNPMLPDDENSKSAACAKNVYDIWQKTAENRGAQIIFCDLSTPHFDDSFNIYDDLREKLTQMGIPKEEIVYIHEAPTEAKKKELFAKVRTGAVRVLIGSTAKMGTGTNVQTRLAAMHDLDCPWRPSDLEQRSGRIIRQGNTYETVDIFRYVTKNTFDAYNWQLIENKQKFTSQIMTSKSPARCLEDTDETTLSYAEIKALATGNPLIKEKMDLDVTVSRLTLLKSSFMSQKYTLEDQIRRHFPTKIQELEQQIVGLTSDLQQAQATEVSEPGKLSPMEIEGRTFLEKKDAGAAILAACKAKTTPEDVPLGSYRGFSMELSFESFVKEFQIILRRERSYTVSLGSDALGNLQRIDNTLDGLENRLNASKALLETTQQQLETAKEEVQKPFPKEQELTEKSARLQELNSLLNMDQRDDTILDDQVEETVAEKEVCAVR